MLLVILTPSENRDFGPPPGFGTIAIGQEDSGTIDRGFSLVESLHWTWPLSKISANKCFEGKMPPIFQSSSQKSRVKYNIFLWETEVIFDYFNF